MNTQRRPGGRSNDEQTQIVIFRLGGENYGVPVARVKEIIRPIDAFAVPGMTGPVEGVINLRGEIIPVLRIHGLLGVDGESSGDERKRRIVILDADGGGFGFLVDEVTEVVRIATADMRPAPEVGENELHREAILGIVQVSGRMVVCVDLRVLVAGSVDMKEMAGQIS